MRLAVWSGSESKRILSEAVNTATARPSGDGKTRDYGVEDGGSGHSQRAEEKAMLEEDLSRMGYHGLMLRPWSIKYKRIVQEL